MQCGIIGTQKIFSIVILEKKIPVIPDHKSATAFDHFILRFSGSPVPSTSPSGNPNRYQQKKVVEMNRCDNGF